MAKVISDEIMKLKIIVNGDEGQKQILEFERANKTLSLRIKDLTDKQKELSKQRKQDSAEYKANKLEIEKLSSAIADNKKKIDDQIKSMDNSRLTMEQLRKKAADLKLTMNNMNPNSKDFATVQKDLKGVETRMLELRNGARASGSSISNLADKFNHYSGIATALTATLAGVVLSVQGVIDYNNKLVDAQTKVGKATGMTNEEVKELTKSFSEFKTRTSNMDLLKIAEVGGKLGVPKEEIKAFTQEVDKAYVALGDNFSGGVEAVANKLGKLKGLFKETKDQNVADAINDIGSALNELDNQGTASAENVSDFALRVGTLPEKLKPTIAETLGLGAAFEESGINAERASSGYNKFVRVAATETKKFAEVMRISEQEVKNLINQDPLQFFLKFAEGAKGLDATEISKMLEFLKLNDAEVISVIGAASESTDRFRESIETSNQALAEGTSLQEEFNRVNTNTAAIFDKVKKSIIGAFSSETVAKGLNWLITQFAKFIGAVEDADGRVTGFRSVLVALIKIITVAIASTISYNLMLGTYNALLTSTIQRVTALNLVEKTKNATSAIGNTLRSIGNALLGAGMWITAQFTRNLNLQVKAQERLNLVTKANPWGALLSILVAVGAAMLLFREESEKTVNIQKQLNDVLKEGAKNAGAEVNSLEQTYKKLTDKNIAEKERQALLDQANKQYPGYFNNLSTEDFLLGKAVGQYNKLRDAIIASAQARAASDKMEQIQGKYLEDEIRLRGIIAQQKKKLATNKYIDETRSYTGQGGGGVYTVTGSEKRMGDEAILDRARKELANLMNEKNALLYPLAKISQNDPLKKTNESTPDTTGNSGPGYKNPGTTSTASAAASNKPDKEDKLQKEIDDRIKREDAANKKLIDLQRQNAEERINLIQDEYEREKQLIDLEEKNKLADVIIQKKDTQDEINAIDSLISKTKNEKDRQALKDQKTVLEKSLKELNDRETIIKETYQFKRLALEEKHGLQVFKQKEEEIQKKLSLLQREENETIAKLTTIEEQKAFLQGKISDDEISKLKTWNDGKQAIQKYYQQESLNLQTAYLQELIKQLEQLPADKITPEQQKALEGYRNELAKTLAISTELKNGGSGIPPGKGDVEKADFSSLGGSTDILGMTTDQWKLLFTNTKNLEDNLKKVGAAINIAQQMYAQFYAFQKANMDAELRKYEVNSARKKKRLELELKSGQINQETYKRLSLQLDEELEAKKEELRLKAARRERNIAIAQAIANTALGITQVWVKPGFPMAIPLTAVVAGMGALQVATIQKQYEANIAPGAEDGYYPTIREQDGKMFNAKRRTLKSGLYSEPTVLVGEGNKTELVVDSRTLKRINPTIQQEYMREIQRVKGYETGMIPSATSSGNDQMLIQAMQVMDEVRLELSELRKYGVIARWENLYKAVDQIDQTREERQRIINKNKR